MSTISSTDERLFKTLANADVVDVARMDAVKEMDHEGEDRDDSYADFDSQIQEQPPSRFDSIVNEHMMERRSRVSTKGPQSTHSVSSVRNHPQATSSKPPMPPMPPMPMGRDSNDDMLAKQCAPHNFSAPAPPLDKVLKCVAKCFFQERSA